MSVGYETIFTTTSYMFVRPWCNLVDQAVMSHRRKQLQIKALLHTSPFSSAACAKLNAPHLSFLLMASDVDAACRCCQEIRP